MQLQSCSLPAPTYILLGDFPSRDLSCATLASQWLRKIPLAAEDWKHRGSPSWFIPLDKLAFLQAVCPRRASTPSTGHCHRSKRRTDLKRGVGKGCFSCLSVQSSPKPLPWTRPTAAGIYSSLWPSYQPRWLAEPNLTPFLIYA